MTAWPARQPDDALAIPEGAERHRLEVLLDAAGRVADVRLDDRSIWPGWFKLEWKGNGQISAKAGGLRLSTRAGDRITIRVVGDAPPPS
jgi:hypothetical protein